MVAAARGWWVGKRAWDTEHAYMQQQLGDMTEGSGAQGTEG